MSRPLKIAMVGLRGIDESLSGGIERHVEELATRMVARGHEVTVFCRAGYVPAKPQPFRGVKRVIRPCIQTKHLEAITHTMACMPSVISGFDIVHFHDIGPSLMAWAPRLFGKNVVATVHRLSYLASKWGRGASLVLRIGAWSAAMFPSEVIVVSREMQKHYKDKWNRESRFIPNGVNKPERRELDSLRQKFGLEKDRYILSLGRITPEKGIEYLIRAFRKMDTPHKLVIAGDALFNKAYAELLQRDAENDPRIVFTGGLYGAEKDEAFSNALAFVMPSLLEGMPIAMLEAMSYACPTLTSDTSACAEVWQDAVNTTGAAVSALSRMKDPDDIREKLETILHDPNRADMGIRSRDFVLSRYNWDDIATATLEVYEKAVAKRKGGRQ